MIADAPSDAPSSANSISVCSIPLCVIPIPKYTSRNRHQPILPSTTMPKPHRQNMFPSRCINPPCMKFDVTHCHGFQVPYWSINWLTMTANSSSSI